MVKYWDADKFALLLELPGHAGEVWALAVAPDASFVVTAGHDRYDSTTAPRWIDSCVPAHAVCGCTATALLL